jgi:hypothetical protein
MLDAAKAGRVAGRHRLADDRASVGPIIAAAREQPHPAIRVSSGRLYDTSAASTIEVAAVPRW